MSAPFFVPFNFQPTSIQRGSGTYTVPAGKYARVTISVTGEAYGIISAPYPSENVVSNGSFCESVDIFLKSGDVLTVSQSNASATGSTAPTSSATAITTVNLSINSTIFAVFTCRGYAYSVTSGSPNNATSSVSGSSSVNWIAQEFNEIT